LVPRIAKPLARGREVLGPMAEGRTNGAIAERLVISEHTVEKHVANVMGKLQIPAGADDRRRVLAVVTFLDSAWTVEAGGKRPPVRPFSEETARQNVQTAEDASTPATPSGSPRRTRKTRSGATATSLHGPASRSWTSCAASGLAHLGGVRSGEYGRRRRRRRRRRRPVAAGLERYAEVGEARVDLRRIHVAAGASRRGASCRRRVISPAMTSRSSPIAPIALATASNRPWTSTR
jgi:Bacterial regulatory proteins, luxR family